MKRKINAQVIGITFIAIIVTMAFMLAVFYSVFQKQVMEDLRLEAEVLKNSDIFSDNKEMKADFKVADLRITWIDVNGEVLFDNDANIGAMNNHASRPEVEEALKTGHGKAIRRSATMDANTYYYAIRLDDGSVLRVCQEAGNLSSLMQSAIPVVLLVIVVMILFSVIVTHFMTKKIIAPIESMANQLDDYSIKPVYKELVPFVDTIRKQHENILQAAMIRQDFTTNISHELKTPLTAIIGYSELIENKMVDEEKTIRFATDIRQNSERLLSLINDVINLSELDHMEKEKSLDLLDLDEITRGCTNTLAMNAKRQGLEFSYEGQPCEIRGNKELLIELIMNLGENAIRYNKENGSVTVRVGMEDGKKFLQVKDTGIGIPTDCQERVFERFFRVDKSRSKQTGGTGLGLAIVKHIVAIHDATLSMESEVGRGTCIRVNF